MGHGVRGNTRVGELDAATAREVAETMQALATPSRVRILGRLRRSACSVGELANAVDMEQSAVSHQLRILRHLGLVVGERRGRSVIYALHDSHVADLLDQAVFHIEHLRLGYPEPIEDAS
jgi:DNA-binding transcriptional ArsR family regulator